MTTQRPTQRTAARTVVSLLCLALFLFLQTLAATPGLHRHLHHDADQVDHQCAVTILSQGNLQVPASGATPIILPVSFCYTVALPFASAPTAVDYRLLPGRAPPSVFA